MFRLRAERAICRVMAGTLSPYIIPLFIPHEGCPHRCVFCNQQAIAGLQGQVTAATVAVEVASQLGRPRNHERPVQVAFYGGSFTALSRQRQEELLDAVLPFRISGQVAAIRLSTRPDCVDAETAGFLQARGVTTVELGVQSMNPAVLAASGRRYSAGLVREAFAHLRRTGLVVGGQLMLGLPGETSGSQLAGLRQLLSLQPDFLRFYPTLVLGGSRLAASYRAGHYRPLSLQRAVAMAARMKAICDAAGVRVVRMGLQPSPELELELLAGPYHPAFGELVLARMMFNEVRRKLAQAGSDRPRSIAVAAADESIFRGPGNCSIKRLIALGLLTGVAVKYQAGQRRQTLKIT
jgi:histone acetyltransferase (RNA polymerase elongator complex component)